jgi:polysaccharide biosynthesis protein PslH
MGSDLPLKILFIVPYIPNRIRTRPFHLIRTLAGEGHRVTLATLCHNQEELADARQLQGCVEDLVVEEISAGRRVWNCVQALASSRPLQADYSWSPKLAQRITQIVESKRFDVVHVEHLRGVRYGLLLQNVVSQEKSSPPPVIWDSVDCISRLFRFAAQESCTFRSQFTTKIELRRTEQFEGWLAKRFSQILVTSDLDRQDLLKLAKNGHQRNGGKAIQSPTANITVVPNGVDLDYFSPGKETREPLTLVITGKMSYHANVTAVVGFANKVMPTIWAKLPETQLWVVGKDPAPEIQRLGIPWNGHHCSSRRGNGSDSRIKITGGVEDIRPFLHRATLAVAPIRYGVGIQNKVLEALSCGTPVVATEPAVAALRISAGRDLLVARDERQLAESILSSLKNPQLCTRLSLAGRLFVEREHGWRPIVRTLTEIYRTAGTEHHHSIRRPKRDSVNSPSSLKLIPT